MTTLNLKFLRNICFGILISLSGTFQSAYAESYLLIVNEKNDYSTSDSEAKSTIKKMFLKKMSSWPNGKKVKTTRRSPDSKEHAAFMSTILGMSASQMASYWMGLKQKTGETPPRAARSAKSAVKLVGKKEGAFSYIAESDSDKLSSKVRVLFKY